MIAIDTNVLVRFITQDDPGQTRRVQRCFATVKHQDESLFLNHIVLCECVWVLSYSLPKSALVDVLDRLLATKQFVIEDKPVSVGCGRRLPHITRRFCGLPDRHQKSQRGL